MTGGGYLTGDPAMATVILWASGMFDTAAIAKVLHVREDAVYRTLHDARDTAAGRKPERAPADIGRPAGGAAGDSERGAP